MINLPTYLECEKKADRGEANPLEEFILKNEPGFGRSEIRFREGLAKLVSFLSERKPPTIFRIDGVKMYDPRVAKKIVSDNPALIFGYMVTEVQGAVVGGGFWHKIGYWADYLDACIPTQPPSGEEKDAD